MSDHLDWFRTTLLAALGLSTACGPQLEGENDEGAGDGTETAGGSTDGGASSAGSTDASGSDGTSASTNESGEPPVEGCLDADPIMQAGDANLPTGFVHCADGSIQRVDSVSCEDPLPGGSACPEEGSDGTCRVDADCTDAPHGRCVAQAVGGLLAFDYCGCVYGCADDADCSEGRVCACGGIWEGNEYPGSSRCISAGCELGDDCDSGACALGSLDDGCFVDYKTACTTPQDTCVSNADCDGWASCYPVGEHWQCESAGACGRPLLVDGMPRTAALASTDTWIDPSVRPDLTDLDASNRRVLADHWTQAALMEHASIASFARFCVQLLQLGAPSDLIAETTRAMADETDHARRCFALASAYRGMPLGPGTLETEHGTVATREAIMASLVEEACVGETLAAIEAEHAARLATDPAVADVLRRIAADELRHATLGWRTLRWMLTDAPADARATATTTLHEAIASARRTALRGVEGASATLTGHGVLPATLRRTVLTRAIEQVIVPCFAAVERDVPNGPEDAESFTQPTADRSARA